MRYLRNNLQVRYTAGFIIVAMLSAGLALSVMYFVHRTQMREQTEQHMKAVANLAIQEIDGDLLASLVDKTQENSDSFLQVQRSLQGITDSNGDIASIYTLRVKEGNIAYVAGINLNHKSSLQFGDVFTDLSPTAKEIILGLTSTTVDKNYVFNPWGTSKSAFVPIFSSEGVMDGVLGIDFRLDGALAQEQRVFALALGMFVGIITLAGFAGWQLSYPLTRKIQGLTQGIEQITEGNTEYAFQNKGSDELSKLGSTINTMIQTMKQNSYSLEQRVRLRTDELESRARYLESAAKVSLTIASILEPERLLKHSVDYIREQFGFYYAGLFLVDPTNHWAVLRAGTGKAGQILLTRGYRVEVGEEMVGWVIANAQSRVSLEVGQDALKLSTPELPLTRSEAVLPLSSRNRVIGALSIQSDRSGAFDRQLLDILQILADQVAVAIDNSFLFAEAQESNNTLQETIQQYSTQAWSNFISKQPVVGYQATSQTLIPLQRSSLATRKIMGTLPATTVIIRGNELQLPVKVRGRLLGFLQAHKPGDDKKTDPNWSDEEIHLMQDLLDQLIIALDNARLYSIAQRSAERDRILADVTSQVRSSTNIDTILQTAIQQLAEALHVPKGAIVLRPVDVNNSELPREGSVEKPE